MSVSLPPRLLAGAITTVDCHCGGLPTRVVVGGMPKLPGETAWDLRLVVMEHCGHVAKRLLQEPRGYPCQNVVFVQAAPEGSPAAFSIVICENNNVYPLMSGHNCINTATALVECGMVDSRPGDNEFTLDTPAGLVAVVADVDDKGKARSITLVNVPSYVCSVGNVVKVPEFGEVTVDIAYGGMIYAIVPVASIGLELTPENAARLTRAGEMIKYATREQFPTKHHTLDYHGPDILAFTGPPPPGSPADAANAVVMSTRAFSWEDETTWKGNIDRSPCGSGTSAIMALRHSRGELSVGDTFTHESLIGSLFEGVVTALNDDGGHTSIVPSIKGTAWITQLCTVVLDPTDPFPSGYTLGDIW